MGQAGEWQDVWNETCLRRSASGDMVEVMRNHVRREVGMKTFVASRGRAQRGFSLTEVLVALLLTQIVMAAVFALLQRGQEVFRREPEITDLNQNARTGLAWISQDLTQAGYKTPASTAILWRDGGGINPDELTVVYADPDVPTSEPVKCGNVGGGSGNGGGGGPCNTIDQSSVLNIDPATLDPAPADPEQAYQDGMVLFAIETADCNGDGQIGMYPFELTQPPKLTSAGGTDTLNLNHNPAGALGLNPPGGFNGQVHPDCAIIGVFRVVQYRINPLPPTPNPALERRDLSTGEPWIPVAGNIENLQLQYAQGVSNNFVDTPVQPVSDDPTTWITGVKVTVTGRTESLNLSGGSRGVFQAQDTHVRKTFSTTMGLRNLFFAGGNETNGDFYN